MFVLPRKAFPFEDKPVQTNNHSSVCNQISSEQHSETGFLAPTCEMCGFVLFWKSQWSVKIVKKICNAHEEDLHWREHNRVISRSDLCLNYYNVSFRFLTVVNNRVENFKLYNKKGFCNSNRNEKLIEQKYIRSSKSSLSIY